MDVAGRSVSLLVLEAPALWPHEEVDREVLRALVHRASCPRHVAEIHKSGGPRQRHSCSYFSEFYCWMQIQSPQIKIMIVSYVNSCYLWWHDGLCSWEGLLPADLGVPRHDLVEHSVRFLKLGSPQPLKLEVFELCSVRSKLGPEPKMILRLLRAAHLNHLL